MIQFLAAAHKEILLLRRDRVGLLVLFLMPALLVLVITLVQNNATRTIGESRTSILLVDYDGGPIGDRLAHELSKAEGVSLTRTLDGRRPDRKTALRAVAHGDFQLCLIIPEGMGDSVRQSAGKSAREALSMPLESELDSSQAAGLELYFDPTLLPSFRSTVKNLLQLMVVGIEVEEKVSALSELLPLKIQDSLSKSLGPMGPALSSIPDLDLHLKWSPQPIFTLREASALEESLLKMPDAVQQNVPAWALFGVFFIALPMAGSFVKERIYGLQYRMLSMPVSYPTVAAGKVFAFMLVCVVQFVIIFCIGKWILPLLGAPSFDMSTTGPWAALCVAFSAILAATGYGILLGTAVRTYEQASMFGPISIVIASALGGIMVPVWAMPRPLQEISVFSPLCWAQNAFLDIFVRGGGIRSVSGNITRLLIFAVACIVAAWLVHHRRASNGARLT
jgi:ABC-2 type transport system permease protein